MSTMDRRMGLDEIRRDHILHMIFYLFGISKILLIIIIYYLSQVYTSFFYLDISLIHCCRNCILIFYELQAFQKKKILGVY